MNINYPYNLILKLFGKSIDGIDTENFTANFHKAATAAGVLPRDVDIILLHERDGWSYAMISKKYSCSRQAAQVWLHKAINTIGKVEFKRFFYLPCVAENPLTKPAYNSVAPDNPLNDRISKHCFPDRYICALEKAGYTYISDIAKLSRAKIRKIKGVGSTGAVLIEAVLKDMQIPRTAHEVLYAITELAKKYKISYLNVEYTAKYLRTLESYANKPEDEY